jgi:hypothetical protein
MKSDVNSILLRVASHLPQGASLTQLSVAYDEGDSNNGHVTINMAGNVFNDDPNEEIKVVNQVFSDFKNDQELSQFVKKVTISLNLEETNGRQVANFNINCT